MALGKEEIESLHNRGLMPDWAYYQQNEKSASENFQKQKIEKANRRKYREEVQCRLDRKNIEEQQINKDKLEQELNKAINEVLNDLEKIYKNKY